MVGQAIVRIMEDGKRLHLQHGPIDIIAQAFGDQAEVGKAYELAADYFQNVLEAVVNDLALLKRPVGDIDPAKLGAIGQRMYQVAFKFNGGHYVTPMAGVAGTISDGVIAAMSVGSDLQKIYVNNGGDIAFRVKESESFTAGIVNNLDRPELNGTVVLSQSDDVAGVATSGWRGRSQSMGIADAVTVLAKSAADADVAATLIAGDVWVEDPAVHQRRAIDEDEHSDLGAHLITTEVGAISFFKKQQALERGLQTAANFMQRGLIRGAYLSLQGETRELSVIKNNKVRNVA